MLPCQALAGFLMASPRTISAFSSTGTSIRTPSLVSRRSFAAATASSSSSLLKQAATSLDYGLGMDQQAMMESDMLVTVDEHDLLVEDSAGGVSKKLAHTFTPDQPRGICHRAFSLFLFNPKGEMLLTQRANSKITFPSVWTNTCCSHPLVGMAPNEVDVTPAAYPQFDGIKHAAIRKAKHELGIATIEHSNVQFVSRFHYWASDTRTHGSMAPWGEHEVDYILFCQMAEPDLSHVDAEEVANAKYVSIKDLKKMMQDPQHIWSPWFLGIMERGGFDWWADLQNSLEGKNTNTDVTFFDPDPAFVADYNLPSHTRQTGVLSSSSSTR
jgi:isopentenyl-diphosphate delta-isomerase type 1